MPALKYTTMKNGILVKTFLLSVAAIMLFACGQGAKDPAAQLAKLKEQKAKIEAQIAELEKQAGEGAEETRKIKALGISQLETTVFRHYIDLQGKVDAEDNVPVTAKMPGTLTRILVQNGSQVRQGQLLAQLDDQIMQKGMEQLELQLQTATDIYQRQKSLWDQNIGTEIQFIQAKTQKEAIEKNIASMKEQMNQTKIYAPISGTVDMMMLKAGQAISPGYPLCNIINLSRLKITGNVPEAYASKVRNGDQVVLYFPDLKKEVNSRVTYVSKSINPLSRTFSVECALPAGVDYRANMVAVVKIIDYQNKNAVVVPVNVIQTAEDGEFVMVAEKTGEKSAIVKKTLVKQGNNYNGQAEILSGLKKGDWIVSTGYQEVNNGETIAY